MKGDYLDLVLSLPNIYTIFSPLRYVCQTIGGQEREPGFFLICKAISKWRVAKALKEKATGKVAHATLGGNENGGRKVVQK